MLSEIESSISDKTNLDMLRYTQVGIFMHNRQGTGSYQRVQFDPETQQGFIKRKN